jgi:hypothetical protein
MTSAGLRAQTSVQRLTFSLLGEYQTNVFVTNTSNPASALTNENSYIRDILFGSGNVVKAIAVDLEGANWTNWAGAALVREVNLSNGSEGIFLRINGRQTNVSSFFGGSFSNNFTAELTNSFPVLNHTFASVVFAGNGITDAITYTDTNDIANFVGDGITNLVASIATNGVTNVFTNGILQIVTNNFNLETPLVRGWVRMPTPTSTTTNFTATAGLYYISLNTTNLKFNLLAVGNGSVTNVSGQVDGVRYERAIASQFLGTAGAFYLNTTTNIFGAVGNPPVYLTGVMRGTFSTSQPGFLVTNSLP